MDEDVPQDLEMPPLSAFFKVALILGSPVALGIGLLVEAVYVSDPVGRAIRIVLGLFLVIYPGQALASFATRFRRARREVKRREAQAS